MTKYYDLVDYVPRLIFDTDAADANHEILQSSTIGDLYVATFFLSHDHCNVRMDDEIPIVDILFNTSIEVLTDDGRSTMPRRYATYTEAQDGHNEIVGIINSLTGQHSDQDLMMAICRTYFPPDEVVDEEIDVLDGIELKIKEWLEKGR